MYGEWVDRHVYLIIMYELVHPFFILFALFAHLSHLFIQCYSIWKCTGLCASVFGTGNDWICSRKGYMVSISIEFGMNMRRAQGDPINPAQNECTIKCSCPKNPIYIVHMYTIQSNMTVNTMRARAIEYDTFVRWL